MNGRASAMLILAYSKESGRTGAMPAASSACLAVGFLHQDKPHRHSLVFDALEPLRPLIDAKVRAFIEHEKVDEIAFVQQNNVTVTQLIVSSLDLNPRLQTGRGFSRFLFID